MEDELLTHNKWEEKDDKDKKKNIPKGLLIFK